MIVSILQLMGFGRGKPIQSRPGKSSSSGPERPAASEVTQERGANRQSDAFRPQAAEHAQASSARRQEVKAPPAKVKPAAKALKTAAKPAAKPAAKKAAPKAVPKAAAKPAPAKKSPAKPAAKAKPAPKPAAKAAAKTAKPAARQSAGKAKVPAKAPAKAAKTVAVKEPVRKAANTPAKSAAKPVAKPAAAPKPVPVPTPAVAAPAPVAARPVPSATAALAMPTKSARPSSRLAQITVPSMAQAVASTAAKASYSQTMPATMIVPPPLAAVKKDPKLANNWKTKSADQLTDEEVLAMPDSEYMNEKQTAFFRLKLVQLKRDMLNNAGETTEHLREDTVVVPDPADRATIEEEHALELRTRDRERKLLKKIEQSIVRLDAGDYGYCDETGEPIGVGRLLARPTATLSLEAQQRRELKQKMFGD
jgi:DnaK suppressor protein